MMQLTVARRKMLWAYIFLAIPILFFAVIRIYPAFFAFAMSLFDYNPLAVEQPFVGFENYQTLLGEMEKTRSVTRAAFVNTATYIALGMPLQLLLALAIALMLNEIRSLATLFRLAFFLPFVTSTIAVSWVFRWLYQPQFGLFNVLLKAFSLPQQPFLNNPKQALPSILAVVIWQGLGFAVVIFLAGLGNIPAELYEAARIDGAGSWKQFRHVTLPLLSPTTFFLMLIATIGTFQAFTQIFLMRRPGAYKAVDTINIYIYEEIQSGNPNYAYGSAMAFVLFAVILALTLVQNRFVGRRVFYG